jgi:hypothetical protein
MAARKQVTVSSRTEPQWLSAAERRAAKTAMLSTKQAELKQEAAERRLKRAANQDRSSVSATPNKAPRRSGAR